MHAELSRTADTPPVVREFTTAQAVAFLHSKGSMVVDDVSGEVA